jgi:hypothetical protein
MGIWLWPIHGQKAVGCLYTSASAEAGAIGAGFIPGPTAEESATIKVE